MPGKPGSFFLLLLVKGKEKLSYKMNTAITDANFNKSYITYLLLFCLILPTDIKHEKRKRRRRRRRRRRKEDYTGLQRSHR